MRFGDRRLFEDVTCTFLAGRRYAITGPNGAGKSTLMKILTGEIEPSQGLGHAAEESRRSAPGPVCLRRIPRDRHRHHGQRPAVESAARSATRSTPSRTTRLTDEDGMRLGELEGIVGEEGGYTAEADAAVLLDGLGVEASLHERKMSELQGGQKVRVLLAQALFGNPPALLLDEPTNHLDLDSVHWLQDYLCDYEGVLIVISHDRHFLNSVCTHIADIDYQTVIMYTGGYDDMVLAKTQIRSRIEAENAAARKEDRAVESNSSRASRPARGPRR